MNVLKWTSTLETYKVMWGGYLEISIYLFGNIGKFSNY